MCKGCGSNASSNYIDPNIYDPCKDDDCGADPCSDCDEGCKQQIDADCVFYGINDPTTQDLENIGAYPGVTLTEILKNVSDGLASNNPLDMSGVALGYLRTKYNIVTFKNFAEAVVAELQDIKNSVTTSSETPSASTCYTFTIKNNTSSTLSYSYRNCSGVKVNNVTIPAGSINIVKAQGLSGSDALTITNNGVL